MPHTLPEFPDQPFWTPTRVSAFCSEATPISYRKGSVIFFPEDFSKYVFLIESGRVNTCYYSPAGAVITLFQDGPGEVMGVKGAFRQDAERLFHAVADTDVHIWKLPRESFFVLLRSDFQFVLQTFERFSYHLELIERNMLNSVLLSAHHRLVLALLELADQVERTDTNSVRISITQQELSNRLSVTRQTTSACLKDLQAKGLLKTGRGWIELFDPEALRQEVL